MEDWPLPGSGPGGGAELTLAGYAKPRHGTAVTNPQVSPGPRGMRGVAHGEWDSSLVRNPSMTCTDALSSEALGKGFDDRSGGEQG